MVGNNWQPTTDNSLLQARARLLQQIREFFYQRQVLEVDTPLLASAIGTDPALDPVRALLKNDAGHEQEHFLQTSPEFPMKRLLAAGSGPIYQLGKAFRNGEAGRKHNPEFTMLEWYSPGFSMEQLISEVDELFATTLDLPSAQRISYGELFMTFLDIDPFTITLPALHEVAKLKLDVEIETASIDLWLDLLFSHCIEPELREPVCIYNYPATQAALAALDQDEQGRTVARRFEFVAGGLELANGYYELTDSREQRRRFQADQAERQQAGLPTYDVDEYLLAALDHGMPNCAGVAVGVDRLLMLQTGKNDIRDVISFPVDRV